MSLMGELASPSVLAHPYGPHASLGVTRIRNELAPAEAGWVPEVSGYPDAVRRDIVAGSM